LRVAPKFHELILQQEVYTWCKKSTGSVVIGCT
jgi:hypothetical protein